MKKLILILSIFVVSLSAIAADLNPFAYGLRSSVNALNPMQLDIWFSINAPATSVKVYLYEIDGDWEVEVDAHLTVDNRAYEGWIDLSVVPSDLRGGTKNLNWRVDVKGAGNGSVQYATYVPIYNPGSVDIDNNPENANFGTVFCTDYAPNTKGNANYSSYLCYYDGPGLYIINADATARKMPFQESGNTRYGYNGGVNSDRTAFGSTSKAHTPWRVRVSDDGRIFVTSQTTDGQVLWEAKKACFSATTKAEWQANTGWIKIIADDNANTNLQTTKKTNNDNCNVHAYCNIFNLFTSSGTFIAGPNCGFDVRGSGENLTIVMLSGDQQAIEVYSPAHYRCDEYKLGTATIWEKAPTKNLYWGRALYGEGVQVQYDKTGNVWMCQHRGQSADNVSTLMRYNVSTSTRDYDEDFTTYRRCGGIRFNNDFTQVIIASKGSGGQGGGATLYPVDQATGMPMWTSGTTIQMQSVAGNSLMDFAWDYAGNLYVAGDNGHKLAVYAMPYDASRVITTPAASKYTFSVNCQPGKYHTVTMVSDPDDGGSITCMQGGSARTPGVLTMESCTELTLTAIPAAGHKFVSWTDDEDNVVSTTPEYTFYVTDDITLTANFEYATYSGIVWKNLFIGGEANDIAAESADFPKTNERLWRLMQVEFNKYRTNQSQSVMADCDDLVDSNVTKLARGKKTMLNVYGFFDPVGVSDKSPAKNFFKTNECFAWLKTYLEEHSLNNLKGSSSTLAWMYYPFMFINRTDTALNWYNQEIGDICNYVINGDNCSKTEYGNVTIRWDSFITYGQPKHWRPYWAEHACGLKATMTYDEYMPTVTTWKRPASIATADDYITKIGTSTNVYPVRDWYKWNVPANDESIKDVAYQKYFILAWRKGSPTAEEIVHHVYESNMELHASYVLKNIDEEDRVDVSKYDASNDDVFKLMLNRRWVDLDPDPTRVPTHNLTITRKLQAGMYNTICLPFSVDLTGLADNATYKHPLKDADAYEFAGTTTSTYNESGEPVTILNFNKVTQLQAGVPYLIKLKGNADVTDVLPFTSVACDTILRPSVGGGLIFQPTINPTTVPAGSLILVANNRLAQTTEDGKMNGMRGYFMIDPNNPLLADDIAEQAKDGRVYLSFQKPTTTSIPVAPEAEQAVQPKVRKVMYDGQIYILRGEEVYTITGHRVK